jgi:hypothetical protein
MNGNNKEIQKQQNILTQECWGKQNNKMPNVGKMQI